MANKSYMLRGHPYSQATMKRMQLTDIMETFLERFAVNEMVYFEDDFLGDTINLDNYAVANGGGASVASFAINVQANGAIRATTGTGNGDTASASLIGPAILYGDQNPSIEFIWKPITAVTEARVELGVVDVVPGSTKPVVDTLATPTVNTSVVDAALYTYNHTGSTTTNQLTTIGGSITAAKTTFTPATARAATTRVRTRIMIIGNNVLLWDDGSLVVSHATPGTDYIEGGNPVALWAYVRASSASSKSLDIDRISFVHERAA